MTTKAQTKERDEAITQLREWLKPGDTVYTVLRHRSKSGMQRVISALGTSVLVTTHGTAEGWIVDYSGNVGHALGWRYHRDHGGVVVNGCGMDMGFHLVYSLNATLFPEGFGCIGKGCPSNDHPNGDRDYTPHGLSDEHGKSENREPHPGEVADGCRKHWHRAGGYALRQRWI